MCSARLQLKNYFNAVANNYKETAIISNKVAEQLLSRLALLSFQPSVVVDMGGGGSMLSEQLQQQYPQAQILTIDLSWEMLQQSSSLERCICADVLQLPLKENSVDLIVANFLLPWCENIQIFLRTCRAILKPNGLLIFTTYGPDTCSEVVSLKQLQDMHILGDLLKAQGYRNVVMDVQHLTLRYKDQKKILKDLRQQGWGCFFTLEQMQAITKNELTFEVIFGQAWTPVSQTEEAAIINIPLNKILRRV